MNKNKTLFNLKKSISSLSSFLLGGLPNYGKFLRFRGAIMRKLIKEGGENLSLGAFVNIYNPSRLSLGKNVYIGYSSYIGDGDITIDDEVVIGPFCSVTGGNHLFKDGSVRFGGYEYKPVRIGAGTWLGGHVCVLAGVTIGKGCLIAAGSVVTKDVPDGSVFAGVPAKKIGEQDPNSGLKSTKQEGQS